MQKGAEKKFVFNGKNKNDNKQKVSHSSLINKILSTNKKSRSSSIQTDIKSD